MLFIIAFIALLLVIFGMFMFFTGPSSKEKVFEKRLAKLVVGPQPRAAEPTDILKQQDQGENRAIDFLMARYSLARKLKTVLVEANSSLSITQLVSASAVLLVGVVIVMAIWLPSLPIRLALGVLASILPYMFVQLKRQRRLHKFEMGLPDAMDLMIRGLRAGHSISSAIRMVGDEGPASVAPEFRKCFEQQNFGLPFREAIEEMGRRMPIPDLQFLVTAILVQKESGGNLVEVLEKTAFVIRERIRLKGELAIYTAQGKMTGWILGLLPFVLFILLSFLNPQYAGILVTDPLGQKLVFAGLIGMMIGFYVIRRIVDIQV